MLKPLYCEKSNRICHFATRHPVTVHKVAIVPMDFVSKIYQDFFFQKGHYSKKISQKGHYSKPAAFLTENSDTCLFLLFHGKSIGLSLPIFLIIFLVGIVVRKAAGFAYNLIQNLSTTIWCITAITRNKIAFVWYM